MEKPSFLLPLGDVSYDSPAVDVIRCLLETGIAANDQKKLENFPL
jgi:hypothetical protein